MEYKEFEEKFQEKLGINNIEHLYAYILSLRGFDWENGIDELDLSEIDGFLPTIDHSCVLNEGEVEEYLRGYKDSMTEEINYMLKHDGYEYLIDYINFDAYFEKIDLYDIFGDAVGEERVNGNWYYIIET